MTDRYEDLADHLALEEQAALTGGEDDWHSQGLPERGVPRLKVTDGPVGARGESYTTTTSALFPCGSALGATFDPELVERVGAAIADEARTKAAHVLLGPTINLIRHPLGGRNFEAYSEDPTLTARLVVAFVRGVQSRGVAACAKHFVANDAEIERHTISSDVDERTLREVYLRPFEAAVRDGGVWTVMASYNRINGTFGCEHPWLLSTVLKEEWGFDGLVMSDWFATHATVASALAGLDLEMPGPAPHFGAPLAAAVEAGEVPRHVVAEQARRLLRLLDRVGADLVEPPETSVDDPDRWLLARETSAASMVLLRNADVAGERVLPLDTGALQRVAVIGPNAATAVVQGGGSARVTPHRTVTPLAGLRDRLGARRHGRVRARRAAGPGAGPRRSPRPHRRRSRHRDVVRRDGRWRRPVRQHRSQPRRGLVGAVRARCRSAALPPPRRGHRRGRSHRAPRAQRHVDRAVPGAARPRDGARHGDARVGESRSSASAPRRCAPPSTWWPAGATTSPSPTSARRDTRSPGCASGSSRPSATTPSRPPPPRPSEPMWPSSWSAPTRSRRPKATTGTPCRSAPSRTSWCAAWPPRTRAPSWS